MNSSTGDSPQLDPRQAQAKSREGAILIDVRDADEHARGMAQGALAIPRAQLPKKIAETVSDPEQPVVLMCAQGPRSEQASETLSALGYQNLYTVTGGFNAWQASGLPWAVPDPEDAAANPRYARQTRLPEIGVAGQRKLAAARVLLVGAGGLGSPAALYLAGAGVGQIGLIDHDVVERSNLHRQILHNEQRIGQPKVESAAAALSALNPDIQLNSHREKLDSGNVERLFAGYHLVLDGSDNFATRYLVNDACLKLGLINISAAVQRFEGQLSVFMPGGPCYRCLFPEPPLPGDAPSCAQAGVVGTVPGLLGVLQANEAIKIICGFGQTLAGRLLVVDAATSAQRIIGLSRNSDCQYCDPDHPFPGYIDYENFCGADSNV